jgi:hypothetical protein
MHYNYSWCYKETSIAIRRGRDRMVVGFTTTYAISAYHHWCCEFESRSGRGVHYVIKIIIMHMDAVISSSSVRTILLWWENDLKNNSIGLIAWCERWCLVLIIKP